MNELLVTLIWAALLGALKPLGEFLMMFLEMIFSLLGPAP